MIILQYFDRYMPDDGTLYNNLKHNVKNFVKMGITHVWLPPPTKTLKSPTDRIGYGIYDRYDLGEFNQCGSVRTKYGTKQELIKVIEECHKHGVKVILDVVLNHLCASKNENKMSEFMAVKYTQNNIKIENVKLNLPIKFTYDKRNNKYSSFKWDYSNFNIITQAYIDWIYTEQDNNTILKDITPPKNNVKFMVKNNHYNKHSHGNDDLICYTIYYDNDESFSETIKWLNWLKNETKCDGFRVDAAKHLPYKLLNKIIAEISSDDFVVISELLETSNALIIHFINDFNNKMKVFNYPLFYDTIKTKNNNFHDILNNPVITSYNKSIVNFANNHDEEPFLKNMNNYIKLLYILFLFKKDIGTPCIYNKDRLNMYLDKLLIIRKNYNLDLYNEEIDYDNYCITIKRYPSNKSLSTKNIFILISLRDSYNKQKFVGKHKKYIDILNDDIYINSDENGNIMFMCNGIDATVWIEL